MLRPEKSPSKARLILVAATLFIGALTAPAALTAPPGAPPAILRADARHHPTIARNGMVVSQHRLASEVGAEILRQGGNAVDAAVAVGFALAVVLPRAGNIGGGGFMLIHLGETGRTVAIDYREKAPAAATRDMFLDAAGEVDREKAYYSYQAAGVPGTVAGLHRALTRYGTMPWVKVIAPAIKLAKRGFPITWDLARALRRAERRLGADPVARTLFYPADGGYYEPGELLVQKDLAKTLALIARRGPDAFYRGRIAAQIVATMEAEGGLITLSDLDAYRAVEREPVRGSYRDYQVISMPPPSSGGVHLVQMLNVLEHFELSNMGVGSADYLHSVAETMKLAFADRSTHLGDPDYYRVPQDWLLSREYAAELARGINARRARPAADIRPGSPKESESLQTTHFSVADAQGNLVANTYTLNFSYGSGRMVRGAGFLLNNEMDDFSAKPGTANAYGLVGAEANAIEPGKRPLSSMTPTIVLRRGQPWAATGSPGGSRIITAVLQFLLGVVDFDLNPAEATVMPRFHHQWSPDKLFVERGFSPDTLEILRQRGHQVEQVRAMGSLQSILVEDGVFLGAADPRRPDSAAVGVD